MLRHFLENKDLPVGTTLVSGCKLFGGAVFLSVGERVFSQHLQSNLEAIGVELNVQSVFAAGATHLSTSVRLELLEQVKDAHNDA